MKISKIIIIVLVLISLISCGMRPIDKNKSNSYYRTKTGKIVYSMNGNWIETGTYKVLGVDKKTFSVINENYAKDKNNVYYKDKKINNVDVKTFEAILEDYGKDKEHVFSGSDIMDGISPVGMRVINKENMQVMTYFENKDGIFYLNEKLPVESEDRNKFRILNLTLTTDGKNIFWEDIKLPVKAEKNLKYGVSNRGITSFFNGTSYYEIQNMEYSINLKNKIQTKEVVLKSKDGKSYKLIEYRNVNSVESRYPWTVINKKYITLINNNKDELVNEAVSSCHIDGDYLFVDNKIFYAVLNKNNENKITKIDINTIQNDNFQVLNLKEKNSLGESINKDYAKDGKYVYYQGKIIDGADVKTIELPPVYGYDEESKKDYKYDIKDKNSYYRLGEKIDKKYAENYKKEY